MPRAHRHRAPAAEWIATTIAGLIVLGTVAFLGYEALRPGADDPVLTVVIAGTRTSGGTFVVDVEVKNASRAAAADVHVVGTARGGGTLPAQARIDYVPGLSSQRASLVFPSDPGGVEVRVIGYARP